jgi:hypothetical protein
MPFSPILKPVRVRNSYALRDRFIDHLLWVKTLPCLVALEAPSLWLIPEPCDGPIQADHAGSRAVGRKCHDFETLPFCRKHHDARPGRRGAFGGMDRPTMREWLNAAIGRVQQMALLCGAPDHAALREYLESRA